MQYDLVDWELCHSSTAANDDEGFHNPRLDGRIGWSNVAWLNTENGQDLWCVAIFRTISPGHCGVFVLQLSADTEDLLHKASHSSIECVVKMTARPSIVLEILECSESVELQFPSWLHNGSSKLVKHWCIKVDVFNWGKLIQVPQKLHPFILTSSESFKGTTESIHHWNNSTSLKVKSRWSSSMFRFLNPFNQFNPKLCIYIVDWLNHLNPPFPAF